MEDIILFYIKGRKEGYFNIRLESVLNEDKSTREIFLKGYQLGKTMRKNEELGETAEDRSLYLEKRKAYITGIGYKAAVDDYPVDISGLRGEDKKTFDMGYSAGQLSCSLERVAMNELENYRRQMTLVRNE